MTPTKQEMEELCKRLSQKYPGSVMWEEIDGEPVLFYYLYLGEEEDRINELKTEIPNSSARMLNYKKELSEIPSYLAFRVY